jgi:hypothetical protein
MFKKAMQINIKIKFIFFCVFIFVLGFVFPLRSHAQYKTDHVIINEFLPDPNSYDYLAYPKGEWIELYNPTNAAVDLKDWQIIYASGGSYIINNTRIIGADSYLIIPYEESKILLNNIGDTVRLINAQKQEVDPPYQCLYIKTEPGQSYARQDDGIWQFDKTPSVGLSNDVQGNVPVAFFKAAGNLLPDELVSFDATGSLSNISLGDQTLIYKWKINEDTLVPSNSKISYLFEEPGQYLVSLSVVNSDGIESAIYSKSLEIGKDPDIAEGVVINEFVSDPPQGQKEWIELFNNTDQAVKINDWELHDGSTNSLIKILTGEIPSESFFTYDLTSDKLNNSGDRIILKNSDGFVVDQLTYGDWDDSYTKDNAPAASDPYSVARVSDGVDTNVDTDDFFITTTVTKNIRNVITAPSNDSTGQELNSNLAFQYSDDIYVNELLPNPAGSDDGEWIELYNNGDSDINLNGWQLDDIQNGGSKPYLFDETYEIKAHSFLVIEKKDSKLSLNNSSDTVNLIDPSNNLVNSVVYTNSVEGASYARNSAGQYSWTTKLTKGVANIFVNVVKKTTSKSSSNKGSSSAKSGVSVSPMANDNSAVGSAFDKVYFGNDLKPIDVIKKSEANLNIFRDQDWFQWAMIISELVLVFYALWKISGKVAVKI